MTHDMTVVIAPYILAGGHSRRFGSDKARVVVDGRPMLQRIASKMAIVRQAITVVADSGDKYADLGFTTIADLIPALGPIGGLLTALRHANALHGPETWVLLASCDQIALRSDWLRTLIEHLPTDRQALAFSSPDRWEPLPGLYHASCESIVTRHLNLGHRSLHRLLQEMSATAVRLPSDWCEPAQFNTPEELATFLRRRTGDDHRRCPET